ncbi:MAG: VWA domain-containing protein, partial [Proteobacteria bacterium]|nr:VWA domain-containing protein [Pseudomonadota bacterium]
MNSTRKTELRPSSPDAVNQFLQKVRSTGLPVRHEGQGRLVFAMDATASREPLWDRACHIQGQMFEQTAALGGLEIQLAYYRGYGEFKAMPWAADAQILLKTMTAIRCAAG